jgi:hypothetical protein
MEWGFNVVMKAAHNLPLKQQVIYNLIFFSGNLLQIIVNKKNN